MKKGLCTIVRDNDGDIVGYIYTINIWIEREFQKNFTRTTSIYYLYKDNKIIMQSGQGSGHTLKDLQNKAIQLVEEYK